MAETPLSTATTARRARLALIAGVLLIGYSLASMTVWARGLLTTATDFTHVYIAPRALLAGGSIYRVFTPADLTATRLGMDHDLYRVEPLFNIHPPTTAVLLAPLGLLPYDAAVVCWMALSVALLFVNLAVILRTLQIRLSAPWLVLLAGLALCWFPVQAHLALGQLSLLISACIIGGWALMRRGRDGWGGVLLGIAIAIKLYPGLLLLVLLLRRRWRALGAATLALALLGMLTLVVVGPADVLRYATDVAPAAAAEQGLKPTNLSLASALGRLLIGGPWVDPLVYAPELHAVLVPTLSLLLLALLGWTAWRLPPGVRGDDRALALGCVAMLLLSPISWQHGLVLLLLPFGLLLAELPSRPSFNRLAPAIVALALTSIPDVEVARVLMQHSTPYRMTWYASLLLLAAPVGLALLWWLLSRRASEHPTLNSREY